MKLGLADDVRLRIEPVHASDRSEEFWRKANADFRGWQSRTVGERRPMERLQPIEEGKGTVLIEVTPQGFFVWDESRPEEAVAMLIDRKEMTAHEELEIAAAFLGRRDRHGDGVESEPLADRESRSWS